MTPGGHTGPPYNGTRLFLSVGAGVLTGPRRGQPRKRGAKAGRTWCARGPSYPSLVRLSFRSLAHSSALCSSSFRTARSSPSTTSSRAVRAGSGNWKCR